MEFDVFIQQDETAAFIVTVPALPGCHTFGRTRQEALDRIKEAILAYVEADGFPVSRRVGFEKVRIES